MDAPFTIVEIGALCHMLHENPNPDDAELAKITERNPVQLRALFRRHLPLILDPSMSLENIMQVFNESIGQPKISIIFPPPVSYNENQQMSTPLPPKYRAKSIPRTPTTQHVVVENQLRSIPILPKLASLPAAVSRHRVGHINPKIGSLAAVLYPSLGAAHVCRVLGSKVINNNDLYFLITFFQAEFSPCFVASEYLFQLNSNFGFPLGEDAQFREIMMNNDVTVDWMLERIFSAAQNLLISHSEVLFPQDTLVSANFTPTPAQIQQIMFQCVSCAALLLLCYICSEWEIPKQKLNLVLATILKTNPSKFNSTQQVMARVEDCLMKLLSLEQK